MDYGTVINARNLTVAIEAMCFLFEYLDIRALLQIATPPRSSRVPPLHVAQSAVGTRGYNHVEKIQKQYINVVYDKFIYFIFFFIYYSK